MGLAMARASLLVLLCAFAAQALTTAGGEAAAPEAVRKLSAKQPTAKDSGAAATRPPGAAAKSKASDSGAKHPASPHKASPATASPKRGNGHGSSKVTRPALSAKQATAAASAPAPASKKESGADHIASSSVSAGASGGSVVAAATGTSSVAVAEAAVQDETAAAAAHSIGSSAAEPNVPAVTPDLSPAPSMAVDQAHVAVSPDTGSTDGTTSAIVDAGTSAEATPKVLMPGPESAPTVEAGPWAVEAAPAPATAPAVEAAPSPATASTVEAAPAPAAASAPTVEAVPAPAAAPTVEAAPSVAPSVETAPAPAAAPIPQATDVDAPAQASTAEAAPAPTAQVAAVEIPPLGMAVKDKELVAASGNTGVDLPPTGVLAAATVDAAVSGNMDTNAAPPAPVVVSGMAKGPVAAHHASSVFVAPAVDLEAPPEEAPVPPAVTASTGPSTVGNAASVDESMSTAPRSAENVPEVATMAPVATEVVVHRSDQGKEVGESTPQHASDADTRLFAEEPAVALLTPETQPTVVAAISGADAHPTHPAASSQPDGLPVAAVASHPQATVSPPEAQPTAPLTMPQPWAHSEVASATSQPETHPAVIFQGGNAAAATTAAAAATTAATTVAATTTAATAVLPLTQAPAGAATVAPTLGQGQAPQPEVPAPDPSMPQAQTPSVTAVAQVEAQTMPSSAPVVVAPVPVQPAPAPLPATQSALEPARDTGNTEPKGKHHKHRKHHKHAQATPPEVEGTSSSQVQSGGALNGQQPSLHSATARQAIQAAEAIGELKNALKDAVSRGGVSYNEMADRVAEVDSAERWLMAHPDASADEFDVVQQHLKSVLDDMKVLEERTEEAKRAEPTGQAFADKSAYHQGPREWESPPGQAQAVRLVEYASAPERAVQQDTFVAAGPVSLQQGYIQPTSQGYLQPPPPGYLQLPQGYLQQPQGPSYVQPQQPATLMYQMTEPPRRLVNLVQPSQPVATQFATQTLIGLEQGVSPRQEQLRRRDADRDSAFVSRYGGSDLRRLRDD